MLASGQASSTCVAQALGLSVRTMQRRLGASGVDLCTLVNEVRAELVQRYLDKPRHSRVAVSQMQSYSAPSAFTRWFSGQFGMGPQRWRKQVKKRR